MYVGAGLMVLRFSALRKETAMIDLQTERLRLRNVRAEDAACMYAYRNSELCLRYQRGQNREKQKIAELIENRKDDTIGVEAPFMLAVALKETDEMTGEIVVIPNEGTITLGYSFHPAHYRKGYAFECCEAVLEIGKEEYEFETVQALVKEDNTASAKLCEKLGFANAGKVWNQQEEYVKWIKTLHSSPI